MRVLLTVRCERGPCEDFYGHSIRRTGFELSLVDGVLAQETKKSCQRCRPTLSANDTVS
jgi:hypothetical protein